MPNPAICLCVVEIIPLPGASESRTLTSTQGADGLALRTRSRASDRVSSPCRAASLCSQPRTTRFAFVWAPATVLCQGWKEIHRSDPKAHQISPCQVSTGRFGQLPPHRGSFSLPPPVITLLPLRLYELKHGAQRNPYKRATQLPKPPTLPDKHGPS